ncbi:MAG: Abortive infection protein [Chthonomonadaceae bacterium]|nr:Abortive infection protein [Chthonomonadaceae bacterium]
MEDLVTPARPQSWPSRILNFSLVRIVLAVLCVIVAQVAADSLLSALGANKTVRLYLDVLFAVPASYGAYLSYVRLIEKRVATELTLPRAGKELLGGLLIGGALFTVTIGVVWICGGYHVTGVHRWSVMSAALALAIIAGCTEELLLRGILFRLCERSLGTWIALGITAAVFGALHLANPHASLFAGIAIMIEAGILLAAAYAYTGRLWLPIGIHIAWNFTQGGIFGVEVSGQASEGLLQGKLSGPVWLSGGAFGVENSVIAVGICLAMGVFLLWRTVKAGRIRKPFWAPQDTETHVSDSTTLSPSI